jgi:tripartite-type tricarboxylate transporter receptor subunit TctC
VARAKPDGYTLLVTANGPSVLNKMLYQSLPYDPDTDFSPVSLISDVPQVLVVGPNSPARDLKALIAEAKKKPDGLTMGHPGIGTGGHLAALWFASLAGIKLVPIAYRGALPLITEVLGGGIEAGLPSYIPQVQSVRALAVSTHDPIDFLPGVPTFRASGFDIEAGTFTALAAPAGTPKSIVMKINAILDAFLKTDEAKKQLAAVGAHPLGGPPERLTERMAQEKATWAPIIKQADIKLQ